MKIILTFILVLISGISISSTIPDEEINSEQNVELPRHLYLLGYLNTTFEEIEKVDIELCEKNGGPNTYEYHKRNRIQYADCLSSVNAEIRQLETENALNPRMHNVKDEWYKSHCQMITKFEKCLKNLTESMNICLHSTKHESTKIFYNVISKLMRFMCENGGNRIVEFVNAGGEQCLDSKLMTDISYCANQTVIKYVHATIPDGSAIGGIGKYHLLIPDVEKCTVLDQFQVCVVKALRNCSHSTPADTVNSLFNIVKKVTTCNQFLKSTASSTGILNILLITTAMTIFLQFL